MSTHTPEALQQSPDWLTYTQAAARYRVATRTLYNLIHTGRITCRRFPHRRPSVYLYRPDMDAAFAAPAAA